MPLLNLPNNIYPPQFVKALALSDKARQLVGESTSPVSMQQLREAVQHLAEANAILIHALTDGNLK